MVQKAVPPVNATLCRGLAMFASVSAVAFLVVDAILWLVPSFAPVVARDMSNLQDQPITLTPVVRLVGLAASLPFIAVLSWGLWIARKLFQRLAQGLVFEPETGILLRRVGQALLAYAVLTPFVGAFMSWLITHFNAPGQRIATFGISEQEVTLAIVATLMLTLGSVMTEAAQLAEEHRQFI